jgi:hypothetical protein
MLVLFIDLVVALFNAIAKAKRETVAAEEEQKAAKKAKLSSNDSSSLDNVSAAGGRMSASASVASNAASSNRANGNSGNRSGAAAEGDAAAPKGWAALQDNYMIGSALSVKVSKLNSTHIFMSMLFALSNTPPPLLVVCTIVGTDRLSLFSINILPCFAELGQSG